MFPGASNVFPAGLFGEPRADVWAASNAQRGRGDPSFLCCGGRLEGILYDDLDPLDQLLVGILISFNPHANGDFAALFWRSMARDLTRPSGRGSGW